MRQLIEENIVLTKPKLMSFINQAFSSSEIEIKTENGSAKIDRGIYWINDICKSYLQDEYVKNIIYSLILKYGIFKYDPKGYSGRIVYYEYDFDNKIWNIYNKPKIL